MQVHRCHAWLAAPTNRTVGCPDELGIASDQRDARDVAHRRPTPATPFERHRIERRWGAARVGRGGIDALALVARLAAADLFRGAGPVRQRDTVRRSARRLTRARGGV